MVESKSDRFANNINAHSDNIAKFDPLQVNRLAADSEWRPRWPMSAFGPKQTKMEFSPQQLVRL